MSIIVKFLNGAIYESDSSEDIVDEIFERSSELGLELIAPTQILIQDGVGYIIPLGDMPFNKVDDYLWTETDWSNFIQKKADNGSINFGCHLTTNYVDYYIYEEGYHIVIREGVDIQNYKEPIQLSNGQICYYHWINNIQIATIIYPYQLERY